MDFALILEHGFRATLPGKMGLLSGHWPVTSTNPFTLRKAPIIKYCVIFEYSVSFLRNTSWSRVLLVKEVIRTDYNQVLPEQLYAPPYVVAFSNLVRRKQHSLTGVFIKSVNSHVFLTVTSNDFYV